MINGTATSQGTMDYAKEHQDIFYTMFASAGLSVSRAGFGCYRVDVSFAEHVKSLTQALLSGINLIDTSSNYADGGSERLVGSVLHQLITQGKLKREQVVVVSKAGYLQGQNYQISQERKRQGHPFPELVLYGEGLEHCIHPEFLEDQLTRSIERLQLATIDGYLLHNPEYYLLWAKKKNMSQQEARNEYLRRIKSAFAYLECEVERGRILYYGISSNTFPYPKEQFEYTALSEIWDIAEAISPQHHFRVIEFPLNLLETAAITTANQPDGKTLVEFAADKAISVLTNRPLNAIKGERLVRLNENVYQGDAAHQAIEFRERVKTLELSWGNSNRLNQLAIRALCSTRGITSVLVGMRREQYVEDVLEELRQLYTVSDKKDIWSRIR